MKTKKILMLLESSFPPDIRVEKEAKVLLKAGFDLSLVCIDNGNMEDNWHGMKLYKIPLKNNLFLSIQRITFSIHFEFYNYVDRLLQKEEFNILHVHDLRLIPTALKLKEKYHIKVVADLHENYPAGVREWNKAKSGIKSKISKIFNNYKKWYKIEKESVNKVDKIIAVVDEMKNRMIKQHHIDKNKFVVVSNLEDIDFVDKAIIDENLIQKYKDKFVILYIGGFGVHRGIDTAIKGMQYLKDKNDIILLLVGHGSLKIENEFKNLIEIYNIEKNVEIVGWQPFEKVFTYQKLSNICIVPHNSNEHTNNTIPHKLYQYMMVGKPVIVSSCLPLARIVKEADSGLIFKAGDEKDFAKKVLKIYENSMLQKEFSKNGLEYTFKNNHTWQNESKKLIEFYEKVLSK